MAERHSLLRSLVTPGQIDGRPDSFGATIDVACQ